VIARIRHQDWLKEKKSSKMKTVLKKIWLQMTIAGVIAVSGPYLNRIILNGFYSYDNVADLVAATSVTYIFLAPITCIGGLILSMISRFELVTIIPKSTRFQLIVLLLFGVVIMIVAFRLFSSYIIKILYPSFGQASIVLLNILIWIIATESITNISRPFVMKFASIKLVPIINTVTLLATIIPALALISKFGTTGAAWSIIIGSAVTASLWFLGMQILFIKPSLVTKL
jgi:O-antigen/teichoic acid export membrane protein